MSATRPKPTATRCIRRLPDALTPGRPLSDYYADHPWKDDAGYLHALVEDCQRRCEALPSFSAVQPLLTREAKRARHSLTLNHLPDPAERDPALRHLAAVEFPDQDQWQWFELTAAMCGQLGLFLLLALAAKPGLDEREAHETYDAYWPQIPMLATMLDSFVDQAEDGENGNHQYVSHYREPDRAADQAVRRDRSSGRLDHGPARRSSARCDPRLHGRLLPRQGQRPHTGDGGECQATGSRWRRAHAALMPILRIWRTANAQRAA